ncbi:hypothetical protein BKA61DRAFT_585832 [Leptodontidium sp. MPI-SDFR-AT-0119]|nr:hypothetical protein BKA61DRAFT_585832 [Leptodontidium sp. MPI-SDFR-AT-0119]
MLYNTAILSVLAASTSLISISVAAPVNARRSTPSCPAGTSYYDYESLSGFKGCTATPAQFQSGPRKYWQSCPTGHGNWYVCANGFKGCTTDSAVCDTKSTAPVPGSDLITPPFDPTACPAGQSYYVCATGFKGCSSDSTVCDTKSTIPDPITTPVDPTACPTGQNYYVCANGFKGCSSDVTVCDPKPTPADPKKPVDDEPVIPVTGGKDFCPAGTSYYDYESTSGFKGCTSSPALYKSGPRVYWGSCPVGLGNWYVCANGFKGCNTNAAVCDLKA